jgi:glutathione S-transferase
MPNITLYTNKMSRGRMVHWMLEELGEPYDVQFVEYGASMKSADYLHINPMGKVPALKHGEVVVTETPAILTYLADAFPQKNLIPPQGSPARAAFFRWMFFVAGPLEAATSAKFLGWQAPETTPWGTPSKGFLGFGTLELALDTLENHLKQNQYICGDQFTAADIYIASHLGFGALMTKAYEMRPVFSTYIERTHSRPARQRLENG